RKFDAILRTFGSSYGRLNISKVEFQHATVVTVALSRYPKQSLCLEIIAKRFHMRFRPPSGQKVFAGFLIDREEAHSSSIFRSHVADGRSIGNGERSCTFAEVFHKFANDFGFAQHLSAMQH